MTHTCISINKGKQATTCSHILSVTTHLIGCTNHHWCVGYDGEEQLRLKQQFGARQRKLDKCKKKNTETQIWRHPLTKQFKLLCVSTLKEEWDTSIV